MNQKEAFTTETKARVSEMVNMLWSDLKHVPEMERCVTAADLLAKCIMEASGGEDKKAVILDALILGITAQVLGGILARIK